MKKLVFIGAVALVSLCLSCKKDNNTKKESDYYKDVPELRKEFDELARHPDANDNLSGDSCFDALGEGYALKVEFYSASQGSPDNLVEGYFSIPFENVAPEKRLLPYRYYKFTSEDFANGLAGFEANVSSKVSFAILRIDPDEPEFHFDFIAVTTDNSVYNFKINADLNFPAKKFHLKDNFIFRSGEVETSAVFRHKPIKDKNFDVLSVTVKTPAGEYPSYSTTLNFVVNPVANFSDALDDLRGKYYGVAPFAENFGDHTVYGFHSFDEKVSLFTGENEWGETVVEEFVVPSSSQYLTVGPLYGEGTKFDIFGTVTRFLYLIGSSESYLLLVNSITLNLADITEE